VAVCQQVLLNQRNTNLMGIVLSKDDIATFSLAPTTAREKFQHPLVFTNGCFDLLHVGHLRYLQEARKQGAALFVALNTDASVQRLKGPSRPILPEDERAEMLAALSCVDYVALFDEPTPEALLRAVRPDIYAKGGDYTLDTLPEAPVLKELGIEARFLTLVEGRSTSSIIEKIKTL
jgi:rfaE bifunctional protein nucleotidyltransferase chain/domain